MPAHEGERLTLDVGRRLAVTDQQDLRCPRWWGESRLRELPGLAHAANLPVQAPPPSGLRHTFVAPPQRIRDANPRWETGEVKALNSRPIDTIDLLSLPAFVGTMVWESRVLARRQLREFGDLDDTDRGGTLRSSTSARPAGARRVRASGHRREPVDAGRQRRRQPGDRRRDRRDEPLRVQTADRRHRRQPSGRCRWRSWRGTSSTTGITDGCTRCACSGPTM